MKMTQKGFAEFCGVTTRTVQNWESGANIPPIVSKYFKYVENENFSSSANESSRQAVENTPENGFNTIVDKFLIEIGKQRELTEKAMDNYVSLERRISSLIEQNTRPS